MFFLSARVGALGDELTAGCVFLAFLVGLGSDERGDGGGVGAAALLVDDTLVEWDREDAEAEED